MTDPAEDSLRRPSFSDGLRVIPGSHNRHNSLYEVLDAPREELVGSDDSARPEFADGRTKWTCPYARATW